MGVQSNSTYFFEGIILDRLLFVIFLYFVEHYEIY